MQCSGWASFEGHTTNDLWALSCFPSTFAPCHIIIQTSVAIKRCGQNLDGRTDGRMDGNADGVSQILFLQCERAREEEEDKSLPDRRPTVRP